MGDNDEDAHAREGSYFFRVQPLLSYLTLTIGAIFGLFLSVDRWRYQSQVFDEDFFHARDRVLFPNMNYGTGLSLLGYYNALLSNGVYDGAVWSDLFEEQKISRTIGEGICGLAAPDFEFVKRNFFTMAPDSALAVATEEESVSARLGRKVKILGGGVEHWMRYAVFLEKLHELEVEAALGGARADDIDSVLDGGGAATSSSTASLLHTTARGEEKEVEGEQDALAPAPPPPGAARKKELLDHKNGGKKLSALDNVRRRLREIFFPRFAMKRPETLGGRNILTPDEWQQVLEKLRGRFLLAGDSESETIREVKKDVERFMSREKMEQWACFFGRLRIHDAYNVWVNLTKPPPSEGNGTFN